MNEYTVVIPAWNAQETIAEALDSLLAQDVAPVEIIVVDDGSSDDTAQIVRGYGTTVRLLQQANQGCGTATNAGLSIVSAPLTAFLDSDDVWLPGKAAAQLARLADGADLAGVCARVRTFRGPLTQPEYGMEADMWGRTTMMVRTDAARSIGPMVDPVGGRGDTVDWLARARELGLRFEMMPEVMALRRIRPGSLSYGRDVAKDRGYIDVVRRALERRRALAAGEPEEGGNA